MTEQIYDPLGVHGAPTAPDVDDDIVEYDGNLDESMADPLGVNSPQEAPEPAPEFTEEMLMADPQFQADADLLFSTGILSPNVKNKSGEWLARYDPVRGENGKKYSKEEIQGIIAKLDEEELASYSTEDRGAAVLDEMGSVLWNLFESGEIALTIGDWTDEQQQAFIRTMTSYEKLPISWKKAGRAAKGLLTDPSTYVGIGAIAKALGALPLKAGAKAMLTSLAKPTLNKATGIAMVEGGVYAAAESEFSQAIKNEGDFSKNDRTQTAMQVGAGVALSGTVVYGLGKFLSRGATPDVPAVNKPTTEVSETVAVEAAEEAAPVAAKQADEAGEVVEEVSEDAVARALGEETPTKTNPPLNYDPENPINLDRIESTDDMAAVIFERAKVYKETQFVADDGNPMGVRTLESVRTRATGIVEELRDETGMDVTQFLKDFEGDVGKLQDLEARAMVMRDIMVTSTQELVELTKRKAAGELSEMEMMEYVSKAALLDEVVKLDSLMSAQSSRLLNSRVIVSKPNRDLLSDIDFSNGKRAADAIEKQIQKAINDGKLKPKDIADAVGPSKVKVVMDELNKIRASSMLSGTTTLMSAAISNYTNLLGTPLVELIAHPLMTKGDKLARKRALATYTGYRMFLRESLGQAFEALRSGQHKVDPFNDHAGLLSKDAGENVPKQSWLKKAYSAVHYPHHLLRFLDENVKFLRAKSLAYADGVVMAEKKGFKAGTPEFQKIIDDKIAATFDKNGRLLNNTYLQDVRRMTYTQEANGIFAQTVKGLADAGHGTGRLFAFPFPRTPFNIVNHGMEWLPTLGVGEMLMKQQRDIILNGSKLEKRKLAARKFISMAGISAIWGTASQDNLTGAGPSDPRLRAVWDKTHKPHSIRINGEWISYAKYEPFATVLGVVADLNYMHRTDLSKFQEEQTAEYMNMAVHALVNNLMSKAYFESFEDLLEVFNNDDGAERYFNAWVTSFSPNILRQLNPDDHQRAAYDVWDSLKKGVPVMSKKLPERYDYLGRPMTQMEGRWHPFKHTADDASIVDKEIERLAMNQDSAGTFRPPPYGLGMSRVDFRDIKDDVTGEDIYSMYTRLVSEQRDFEGRTLHEALEDAINSADYETAGDALYHDVKAPKAEMLSDIIRQFRQMAKDELLEESVTFRDINDDWLSRVEETRSQ